MLAGLCVAGALAQYGLSTWLPLMRRVLTPVVSGTALILLAVSVIPIAAHRVAAVPAEAQSFSGVVVAAVTLFVVAGLGLKLSGGWRLWTPIVIGIVAGCVAAVPFGLVRLSTGLEFRLGGYSRAHGFRTLRCRRHRVSSPCCPWPSS